MRPLYETADHLSVEQGVAKKFEARFGCQFIKLPIRYHLDYAIEQQGAIGGFCEIKTSKYLIETHNSYGGFKMSFAKWCAAEQMCRVGKIKFVLIVKFPDGIRYITTQDFSHDGIVWWGRKDRGDNQDMEPAVMLGIHRFAIFE